MVKLRQVDQRKRVKSEKDRIILRRNLKKGTKLRCRDKKLRGAVMPNRSPRMSVAGWDRRIMENRAPNECCLG